MTETRQDEFIFPPPVARVTDPETSHLAAVDATMTATRGRFLALTTLYLHGPLTDFELADHTGLQQNSIGKRRLDCQRVGLVKKHWDGDGKPVRRNAPSGSSAQVWTLTEAGKTTARLWLLRPEQMEGM